MPSSRNRKYNRLAHEKSPYLLQHSQQPVDWYPWCREAFERAKKDDKPIFLSIGYSACHWCHVMAQECFEDEQVAELMNNTFISIKVDREERPDIDMVYMKVCQMMTGSGGWPLTIIMTPDKKPFFAATYIPRETSGGRLGMLDLIPRVKELWSKSKDRLLISAAEVTLALQQFAAPASGKSISETELHTAYQQLEADFDEEYGGFGEAPKFPTPHRLTFLLRYWKRNKERKALSMVEKTLQMMRRGGIYDQLGFGFHRYSTDRYWFLPHFEKMLYDQATTATAYIEAFQATGKQEYARTANEIFSYTLRDLRDEGGAFYSAEAADTEGAEGKFYLWTYDELQKILSPEEFTLAANVFNIHNQGSLRYPKQNFGYILYLNRPLDEIASVLNIPPDEIEPRFQALRQKLFDHRNKRTHPSKDDKILTDWNGLMIAALALGSRVLNQPGYAEAAKAAASFISRAMRTPDGRLLHRYRDGEASVTAYLDDYSFFIYGLLELYETTFEPSYLKMALELNQHLLQYFWDNTNGGFYFTPSDGEPLITRQKEVYDGAIPSGNSIAMLNLLKLALITGNPELEEKAIRLANCFSGNVAHLPSAFTQLMVAVDFAVGPSHQVTIIGDPDKQDTKEMLAPLRHNFLPNKVVVFIPTNQDPREIRHLAPQTTYQKQIADKATAFVCTNRTCHQPTTDVVTLRSLLEKG